MSNYDELRIYRYGPDAVEYVPRQVKVVPLANQELNEAFIRLAGLAAPFGVRSIAKRNTETGWHYWQFLLGCFTDNQLSPVLCLGHDGAQTRVLARTAQRTLELSETRNGLEFVAAIDPDYLMALAKDDEAGLWAQVAAANLLRGGAVPVSVAFNAEQSRQVETDISSPVELISKASVAHIAIVAGGAFTGACCWLADYRR